MGRRERDINSSVLPSTFRSGLYMNTTLQYTCLHIPGRWVETFPYLSVRERERERERERQRQRERERDRQTDRQTDRQRETERETQRESERFSSLSVREREWGGGGGG